MWDRNICKATLQRQKKYLSDISEIFPKLMTGDKPQVKESQRT